MAELKKLLAAKLAVPEARRLLQVADYLVKKIVWVVGGDGWAYDIGYGGLDHVLASGRNINVLVLDTEVYSNTGGQMSKSTPLGATAKFAAGGKPLGEEGPGHDGHDLRQRLCRQHCRWAPTGMQAVKAFMEAEAYDGPSIIIAYSHCIAHGIDMTHGLEESKAAVDSGHWLLYRYDPRLAQEGKNPLQLDSKEPSIPLKDFMNRQVRFRSLKQEDPARAELLAEKAQAFVKSRYELYRQLAAMQFGGGDGKQEA